MNAPRVAGRVAGELVYLVLVLLVLLPAPAQAHTDLVGSTPRDGDTVSVATDRLVLVFGEDLVSGRVVVRDPEDLDVVAGSGPAAGGVVGSTLEVPLDLRTTGRHVATYRVVAADGDTVVGEISFEVTDRTDAGAGPAPAGSPGPLAEAAAAGLPVSSDDDALVPPVRWLLGAVSVLGAVVVLRGVGRALRPHLHR